MNTLPASEKIAYYADMYVKYMEAGNNRRAIAMGKLLVEIIVKNEIELAQLKLYKQT